jgi:AAA15 family ATPase/GTPase
VKKKQSFMAVSVFIIILLLLTFLIFTGCRKARVERLQNLKESSVSSKQTTSQDENNESGDKAASTEPGESIVTSAEITEDTKEVLESDESTSKQNEEESITAEATEAEETTQEEDEEETETAAETVQLTKDFTNLQMEGGTLHSDFFASAGIGAGDYSNNKEARGFASFDISGISGANIIEASIKATALEKYGEPFNNYGPIIIKGVYWGPTKINPSYFNIDGIELANYSAKNFTINNSILIDDLQKAINNGSPRYQICLYFEMNQTNGDNIQDCVAYAWDGIKLHVTYTTIAAADQ